MTAIFLNPGGSVKILRVSSNPAPDREIPARFRETRFFLKNIPGRVKGFLGRQNPPPTFRGGFSTLGVVNFPPHVPIRIWGGSSPSPGHPGVAGDRPPNCVVPVRDAQRFCRGPFGSLQICRRHLRGRVVWQHGASELAVRVDQIDIAAAAGIITISFPVPCDQLDGEQRVSVPLAVGTEQRPAGLVMSTFTQPGGPSIVTRAWSEPIIAFAWEAVVHLAQQLCAAVGKDARGLPLVPGSVGAAPNVLLLQPMARHNLTWRP